MNDVEVNWTALVLRFFVAGVLGIATWWAQLDIAYQTLLFFIAIDYVTGLIAAAVNRELAAEKAFKGAMKKFSTLIAVFFAWRLELVTQSFPYTGNIPIAAPTTCFFIIYEAISILENLKRSDVDLPPALQAVIDRLKVIT